MAGTRWVQSEILDKNPDLELEVYAVWFNMLWSDDKSKWPEDLLVDKRVTHYWDERKVVGHWYEQNVTRLGKEGGDRVEWDAFFLYGRDARWNHQPPKHLVWGRTIVSTRKRLREAVDKLHNPPAAK